MNRFKKAPRKKRASDTVGPDKLEEVFAAEDDNFAAEDDDFDIMEDAIEVRAKILGEYNLKTKEIKLKADRKELDRVLGKAKLAMYDDIINKSFVELKLYNNDNSLLGDIRELSPLSEDSYLILVKLQKNQESDVDIIDLVRGQKDAERGGAYAFVRIHRTIYSAYDGEIVVKKADPIAVPKAAPIEEYGDKDIAVLAEALRNTGYVVYRKGKRGAAFRKHVMFSGVSVSTAITSEGELSVTIRKQTPVGNLITSAGNIALNVYKAAIRRDRYDDILYGKKVSAKQFTVDNDRIKPDSFEDVAEYAKEIWESGIASQHTADSLVVDEPYFVAKIKYKGHVIGKGLVVDFVYHEELEKIEMTIKKLKLEEGRRDLFNDKLFQGGLMITYHKPQQAGVE